MRSHLQNDVTNKKPKPEAVYRVAEDALNTIASQWKERFEYIQEASDEQDKNTASVNHCL